MLREISDEQLKQERKRTSIMHHHGSIKGTDDAQWDALLLHQGVVAQFARISSTSIPYAVIRGLKARCFSVLLSRKL